MGYPDRITHEDGRSGRRSSISCVRKAIEPFNGLFKNVFEWRVKMPVKGLRRSQLLALGAVVVYQLVLLYQHEQKSPHLSCKDQALLRAYDL